MYNTKFQNVNTKHFFFKLIYVVHSDTWVA